MASDEPDGVRPMSMQTILIGFIATGFCLFAATLYWGDLQTRGLGK
jgi:hypothetical protein